MVRNSSITVTSYKSEWRFIAIALEMEQNKIFFVVASIFYKGILPRSIHRRNL